MSFTIKLTDISTLEMEGMMTSTLHFNIMCIWVEHNILIITSQDFWIIDPFWVNKSMVGYIVKCLGLYRLTQNFFLYLKNIKIIGLYKQL
jgi:hypothetical protein